MKLLLIGLTLLSSLATVTPVYANVKSTIGQDSRKNFYAKKKCRAVYAHDTEKETTQKLFSDIAYAAIERGAIQNCKMLINVEMLSDKYISSFRYTISCGNSKTLTAEFSSKCYSSGVGKWEMKNPRIVQSLDYTTD